MAKLMQVGFIGLGQMGRPMAQRLLCPEAPRPASTRGR